MNGNLLKGSLVLPFLFFADFTLGVVVLGVKRRSFLVFWKSLSRKKKVISILSVFLLLLLAGGALAYHLINKPRQSVSIDANGNLVVTNDTTPDLNGKVNILLAGVDERQYQQTGGYRTDTLILASVDPTTKRIELLSIPRDSRVNIPKHGMDKINAAVEYGGMNMTVAVVQKLTGIHINGYIKTTFDGFKSIIDTLGGIEVNVDKNMYYLTGDKVDGVINLKKGDQTLDGTKALEYARFREDALGDIGRTVRQQTVLKAIAKKLMQPSSIPKIPELIPEFKNAVDTNLPLSDLITLGEVAVHFDSSKVISQTLPGYFLTLNGISYWGVDPANAKKVADQLFNQGIALGDGTSQIIMPNPGTGSSSSSSSGSSSSGSQSSGSNGNSTSHAVHVGSLSLVGVGTDSIVVSLNGVSRIAYAEIYRNGQPVQSLGSSGGVFSDTGLSPGTYTYSYVVWDSNSKSYAGSNTITRTIPKISNSNGG